MNNRHKRHPVDSLFDVFKAQRTVADPGEYKNREVKGLALLLLILL